MEISEDFKRERDISDAYIVGLVWEAMGGKDKWDRPEHVHEVLNNMSFWIEQRMRGER